MINFYYRQVTHNACQGTGCSWCRFTGLVEVKVIGDSLRERAIQARDYTITAKKRDANAG